MHILIISSEPYCFPEAPLYGIFQYQQAAILKTAGYKVGVISPQGRSLRYLKNFLKERSSMQRLPDNGVNVLKNKFWNVFARTKSLEEKVFILAGKRLFRSYVRKFGRPDVVHAHNMLYAGLLANELHTATQIPYVITEHFSGFLSREFSASEKEKIRAVLAASQMNLAVSRSLLKKYEEIGNVRNGRYKVAPNVIDPQLQAAADNVKDIPKYDKFTFLSIGALIEIKNHRLLINAFAHRFKGKPMQLHIAGGGYLHAELSDLISNLGLSEQIKLLGVLGREQIKEEICKSHSFVLPSNHETFGVVLIEALCFGLPCVATNSGGPADILTPETGLLTPVKDEKALGDALQQIYLNYNTYNTKKIHEYCLNKFGDNAFLEMMNQIYNSISK